MSVDSESRSRPKRISWARTLLDPGVVNGDILRHPYEGKGDEENPYLVSFIDNDPRDPMRFPTWLKWTILQLVSLTALAVTFDSSVYASGIPQIQHGLGGSEEVNILGVSLFVIGNGLGPFLWAPFSELYGRQWITLTTFGLSTLFICVCVASQTLGQLLVFRFFAGALGSSTLVNAGGVIADMFPPSQRGLVLTIFAAAPFLGPVLGPIIGGFVAESVGWRWLMAVQAIFTSFAFVLLVFCLPETYAPVLLRKRAHTLSEMTGKVYISKADAGQPKKALGQAFRIALSRPWVLLMFEPIVVILSIYQAIVFGTLYMLFAAFPIVYSEVRGWSQGIQGLSFIGVLVGIMVAVVYCLLDNGRYLGVARRNPTGFAPPEARLPPACVGAVLIPIGMFWFAWTNYPSIHWFSSIAAGAPFGCGFICLWLGTMNYLMDSYTIYAASVIATGTFSRSLFGAAFPLFTTYMYHDLGIHWASSIPAFLALLCMPFPFVLYRFGPAIRRRCKYAAEAEIFLMKIRGQAVQNVVMSQPQANESTESIPIPIMHDTDEEKEKEDHHADMQTISRSYRSGPYRTRSTRSRSYRQTVDPDLVARITEEVLRSLNYNEYINRPISIASSASGGVHLI